MQLPVRSMLPLAELQHVLYIDRRRVDIDHQEGELAELSAEPVERFSHLNPVSDAVVRDCIERHRRRPDPLQDTRDLGPEPISTIPSSIQRLVNGCLYLALSPLSGFLDVTACTREPLK